MQDTKIRFYTKRHVWFEKDKYGHWRFGITQYGSEQMNGVTYVLLASGADYIEKGEELASLESRKACEIIENPFDVALVLYENKDVTFNPSILDEKADETSIGTLDAVNFTEDKAKELGLMTPDEYKAYLEQLEA